MTRQQGEGTVRIELLGGFRAVVGSDAVAADRWPSRRAAELVQLLALSDGHRLTRDRAIDALWPRLGGDAGAANLRKAAHHARQALGSRDAVVLRGGQVALFPSASVETDAGEFEVRAAEALASGDAPSCADAATAYGGELLPEALYEDWTQGPRESIRARYLDLLRASEQWTRLVEADPTDESAYRELMRHELAAGRRPAAIRWYGRLRTALRRDPGIPPDAETTALYDECVAGLSQDEPDLIGRQLELATATALLRDPPGGEKPVLVVRGSAGIGKSAFCRELARIAGKEGWVVTAVTASEAAGPYAPVASVVEQIVSAEPAALDAVGGRGRSVLAGLTSLAAPAEPLEGPPARHQVIGAIRRLLFAFNGDGPVALVVDDAHLADEATIDLLQHLGSPVGPPLAIVLAYRPESAPATLTAGVARLARAGRATEIDLAPLEREDAAALVAAGTPVPRSEEVVDRIVDLAEGNPFLTLELARSAVAGVPALVPSASDAIAAGFLDLGEEATAMLRRLALAGDELDPSHVAALTGTSEAEGFALLDVALEAGVLRVAGARYRFRHELVRQALVEQLPPHHRVALHREMASRLADAGAAPGPIAQHWLQGGRPDEAVEWLLFAAKQAIKLGAPADALAHLAPVLDHVPDRADALRLRAEALDTLGDRGAPAAYAAAARVVADPEAQDLRAMQALATIKLGDPEGGLAALEGVEPGTLEGRAAHALALSGAAALGFGDPAIGTAKAAEARRLAVQAGDQSQVVVASWAHAAAAHARGELRESIGADLRETTGLDELAVSVFDGQLCMTQRFLYGSRPYDEVIAFADSLAAEAERLGAARGSAFAVTIRGEAKLLAGRLDEADADLAAGVDLHREISAVTGEAFALQRRSEVAFNRGDHAAAAALLDESLSVARESDVGFHLFDRIYGTRVATAPDAAAGLAALEEAEAAVRGPVETCPTCRITLAVPAAIAATRAGDLERADRWEQVAEYLATVVMRLPAWDAALEEVRGHRARARGDGTAAQDHFRRAADGFGAAEHPLDQARCEALAADRPARGAPH